MLLDQHNRERLAKIAKHSGKIAMDYYNRPEISVEYKADKSPVTAADKEISEFITHELSSILPGVPVVSEEGGSEQELSALTHNPVYWLVDPIDGTKSFIRGSGHFTVNIALIEDGRPVFGAIYHPLNDVLYYTGDNGMAFKQHAESVSCINTEESSVGSAVNLVTSTRYLSEDVKAFIAGLNPVSSEEMASSFKFCLVAEGIFDVYPNFSRLNTWDIAAGHAIILASGGIIYDKYGKEVRYSAGTIAGPHFVALNATVDHEFVLRALLNLSRLWVQ